MAAGGRARADGLPSGGRPFSPYRVSLSLSRRFDARERDGGKIKKKKKKKNEGSDLREKLMFSLESRLSVG